MKTLLSKEELEYQWTIPDFVLKTQKQIAKDFALYGYDFEEHFINSELPLVEIENAISEQLALLMKEGETKLLQLLYQIDIPQSQFIELLNRDTFVMELSGLIVRREAYKVYLRSKF